MAAWMLSVSQRHIFKLQEIHVTFVFWFFFILCFEFVFFLPTICVLILRFCVLNLFCFCFAILWFFIKKPVIHPTWNYLWAVHVEVCTQNLVPARYYFKKILFKKISFKNIKLLKSALRTSSLQDFLSNIKLLLSVWSHKMRNNFFSPVTLE